MPSRGCRPISPLRLAAAAAAAALPATRSCKGAGRPAAAAAARRAPATTAAGPTGRRRAPKDAACQGRLPAGPAGPPRQLPATSIRLVARQAFQARHSGPAASIPSLPPLTHDARSVDTGVTPDVCLKRPGQAGGRALACGGMLTPTHAAHSSAGNPNRGAGSLISLHRPLPFHPAAVEGLAALQTMALRRLLAGVAQGALRAAQQHAQALPCTLAAAGSLTAPRVVPAAATARLFGSSSLSSSSSSLGLASLQQLAQRGSSMAAAAGSWLACSGGAAAAAGTAGRAAGAAGWLRQQLRWRTDSSHLVPKFKGGKMKSYRCDGCLQLDGAGVALNSRPGASGAAAGRGGNVDRMP